MKIYYKILFILPNLLFFILSYGSEVSYRAEDYDDTKDLKNCLVIIVGCAKYKNVKDLPGCKEDIKMVKRVFQEEYGYKVISTDEENSKCKVTIKDFVKFMRRIDDEAGKHIEKKVLEYEKGRVLYEKYTYYSKKIQNLKNEDHNVYSDGVQKLEKERNEKLNFIETTYKCKQDTLKESKIDARKKLVENKDEYDAVIFIFTGRGYLNTISLYEKEVYIKTIINFLARAFQDKPKIVMLFSDAGEEKGKYRGQDCPSCCIGESEIEINNQEYLENFYIMRSCVDGYGSYVVRGLGSVTVLHWKKILSENMSTKGKKVSLRRLKGVLQKVVKMARITGGEVTTKVETVNVTMDTMPEEVFLIPKKNKNKKIDQGSSEEKNDFNNTDNTESKEAIDSLKEQVKQIGTLEQEMKNQKNSHKKEIDSLNNEVSSLKNQVKDIPSLKEQVKNQNIALVALIVIVVIYIIYQICCNRGDNHKHKS